MAANGHSRLPPSKAYSWAECTASVAFIEANDRILPKDGSPEADEGTRAHAYLTATLKHTLGQVPDSPEMGRLMDDCAKFILSLMQPGDRLLVDQRVPLYYLPSQRGTLDIAIVGPRRIIILDVKYGVGVSVYAEKNKQLAIYAESQIRVLEQIEEFLPDLPVELIIYQPRDRNDPTVVRPWITTRGELAEFAEEIAVKAAVVLSGKNTEFKPGAACKFCRATGICKAYATQGLSAIADDEPVDAVVERIHVSPPQLTREQRQRVLVAKKDMIAWLEAVEDQEEAELMHGAPVMSFKLVEGKSNRQWKDDKLAATYLLKKGVAIDAVYPPVPPEIVSPAQAEKALRSAGVSLTEEVKTEMKTLVEKPPGKPTLTEVSDPRPALIFDPTTGLNHITDASELI